MKEYLESSKYIDWKHPEIPAAAQTVVKRAKNQEQMAKACFEFVRDEIKHSWDYQLNPVTCKASEVLEQRTGYCFAKSHLRYGRSLYLLSCNVWKQVKHI